ncbi:hypothetical protein Bca52824_017311 [Brassica carinata]|uniref:Uncharacterized protein n=1 Tax=Brassica carinata TaxID=52824 RepID=A0A8X7VMD4_BRACI|nr:hypothetical protein Bca52824_017311 [Brassica carinata]
MDHGRPIFLVGNVSLFPSRFVLVKIELVAACLQATKPFVLQKPATEHHTLQKPKTSQTQAELRTDKHEASLVYTLAPSLPITVTAHISLQNPQWISLV